MAPWPDYGRLGPFARVFHPEKLPVLWRDLTHPLLDPRGTPYGWFPGEAVDHDAPPATVTLELENRLFDATAPFLTTTDAPVDIDLTKDGPPLVVPNLRVAWTERPVSLLVSRGGADVTGVGLIFEEWADTGERRDYLHERYHRGLMMVLGWAENDLLDARVVDVEGSRVTIRAPHGPFSLVESINNAGQNYVFWRTELKAKSPVELEGPYRVFHN